MLNKKAMKEEVTSSSLKNVGCISNSTSISKFYHKNSLMSSININIGEYQWLHALKHLVKVDI